MPKIKKWKATNGQRKKKREIAVKNVVGMDATVKRAGLSPVQKVVVLPQGHLRDGDGTGRLISSMNLDEMLDASQIVEISLRGEKIPAIKSPKVRVYVDSVLQLSESGSKKIVAEKMQQGLAVQILKQNKKTTNAIEGKRLYNALMDME